MPAQPSLTPATLRGMAFGVFSMAAFALIWSTFAAFFLRRTGWQTWLLIALVTLGLCIAAGRQLERAARWPQQPAELWSSSVGRQFWTVVIAENIAIFLAIFILTRIHRPDLIVSVIALIVGVHFIPLARILGVQLYYASGLAMAGASLAVLRIRAPNLRQGITCAACAITLWITCALVLL